MFTGIIQAIGKIRKTEPEGAGLRLYIDAPSLGIEDVQVGDSIAVNGACMTVVAINGTVFQIVVSAESLSKTTGLNSWGDVNLEKALRVGDRLDGHIVTGHVDGLGQVAVLEKCAESYRLEVLLPSKLSPLVAYKGSIAVNGVSLTINEVVDTPVGAKISINLIPHTMAVTTLNRLKVQDYVNIEVDVIARYMQRMVASNDSTQLF